MRERLSKLLTDAVVNDPRVIVLSGDHGYALFDSVKKERPKQFVNVGVAEQSMIGIAAGLARSGFLPIAYGLAAFVPIRVLEQIKLDLCLAKLPVTLLGDGAGLVYSTLGSSHQCAEDIAALRPMPHLKIYSPADASELEACFKEARSYLTGPSYLRIGKSDRPIVHSTVIQNTEIQKTVENLSSSALIGTGSFSSIAVAIAQKEGFDAFSVPRIKPFPSNLPKLLANYQQVFVLEEHAHAGGLFSAIAEVLSTLPRSQPRPRLTSFSLKDKFSEFCGGHEYALSEHGMTQSQIESLIRKELHS